MRLKDLLEVLPMKKIAEIRVVDSESVCKGKVRDILNEQLYSYFLSRTVTGVNCKNGIYKIDVE